MFVKVRQLKSNRARLSTISTKTYYGSWQAGTEEHMESHITKGHDRMPSELKKMKRAEITAGVTSGSLCRQMLLNPYWF